MNPRRLALALSCLLVLSAVLAVLARQPDRAPAAHAADTTPVGARSAAEALSVLRSWDGRRARAWAAGEVAGLAPLYAAGSTSGRHDRAMLAAYARRGLRVTGLRMQVLEVEVRRWSPDRLALLVTDRLVGGVAVGPGVRAVLPTDGPSTRLVSFVRVAGEWRVEEVQPRAAASTASTSRSVNR